MSTFIWSRAQEPRPPVSAARVLVLADRTRAVDALAGAAKILPSHGGTLSLVLLEPTPHLLFWFALSTGLSGYEMEEDFSRDVEESLRSLVAQVPKGITIRYAAVTGSRHRVRELLGGAHHDVAFLAVGRFSLRRQLLGRRLVTRQEAAQFRRVRRELALRTDDQSAGAGRRPI